MLPANVLEWLWHQLEFNYSDLTRVYREVVECLEQVSSLRPRTDVYTTEQGHSDLLVVLFGPLAANVRGVTYGIPVEIWIPKPYPVGSPIVWVRPTPEMRINPGPHVDVNGRVYFEWREDWSLVGLCEELSRIFGEECPVYTAVKAPPAPPPVPKQPPPQKHTVRNIMDSEEIDTQPPTIPLRSSETWTHFCSLLNSTSNKLVASEVEVDLAALRNTTQVLEWISQALNTEAAGLAENLESATTSIRVLDETTAAARALIAKSFSPKYALPNADEMIVPKSAAARQLLESRARDAAITDTIRTLANGLAQDKLPLDSFLKNVRSLARNQFSERHKATVAQSQA